MILNRVTTKEDLITLTTHSRLRVGEYITIRKVSFSNLDFSGIDLSEIKFKECSFKKCDFRNAIGMGDCFYDCNVWECDFRGAVFNTYQKQHEAFAKCSIHYSLFDNSQGLDISMSHVVKCRFDCVNPLDKRGMRFRLCIVEGCFLDNDYFTEDNFIQCRLINCNIDALYLNTFQITNKSFHNIDQFTTEQQEAIKACYNIIYPNNPLT